ncbi:MAG TPA: Crp/Fnr family transcriptional regulator [Chitinophagaceae bacterium]|jgi:CRP-like cAMP-binding protein|nr:Crp/Fnr family transcriptional regulator [Chitinophagaceae bacterium]
MPPKTLFKIFASKVALTEKEFESLSHYFKYLAVGKKHKLVSAGQYSDRAYIVEKGLLFLYKPLDNGDIQVLQFAKENYWIGDFYSVFSGSKALFTLETIEPCELWCITKADLEIMMSQYPVFETYFRLLVQAAYAHTLVRLSDVYSQDAQEKYNRLRAQQPDLLQRVPQYLIASYLGILPSSLSRIRNKK